MIVWRLTGFPSLDGKGGLKAHGRWHTKGQPIVYTSDAPAGALVELMVNLDVDPDELPESYHLLSIEIPDPIKPRGVRMKSGWQERVAESRTKGDAWLSGGDSAVLRVPSAIVPDSYNFLINPKHPDAARIKVQTSKPFVFDPRLFERTGKGA